MSREKQIEEMAEYIYGNGITHDTAFHEDCRSIARDLYNAGYRKLSEGEWIFKEKKDAFFCSLCDNEALIDASFIGIDFAIAELSDFCPHCGAKMKGGAE